MARCLVSLGANLGDPAASMQQAMYLLQRELGANSVWPSRLFRTPAIGGPDGQGEFLNAVAAIDTTRSPWEVWDVLRKIENQMGRKRSIRWEARAIDLDLLLYEEHRIWTPHFKVPHPRMTMRRFILQPALDVAADFIDPVSGWSIERLASYLEEAPPSVVILSPNFEVVSLIAQQASSLAQVQWIPLQSDDIQTDAISRDPQQGWLACAPVTSPNANQTDSSGSRSPWVSPQTLARLPSPPRSLMILGSTPDSSDIAWEDWLRMWADQLNLRQSETLPRPYQGPRYLLPVDDQKWAIHEVVAAFSAMTCPIEPTSLKF